MFVHIFLECFMRLNMNKTVHRFCCAAFTKMRKVLPQKCTITFTIMFIEFVLNLCNHIPCVTYGMTKCFETICILYIFHVKIEFYTMRWIFIGWFLNIYTYNHIRYREWHFFVITLKLHTKSKNYIYAFTVIFQSSIAFMNVTKLG